MHTERATVIGEEQKAVDHAYACYESRLAELRSNGAATAAASGKDSIAIRRNAEARAAEYDGLGGESLVVLRVDAPEDVGEPPRPWYVGRRSVLDDKSELVVVNWASPLATTWANALPESPGDIVLRRRLLCAGHVVEGYRDEIAVSGRTAPTPKPRRELAPAGERPADTPAPSGQDEASSRKAETGVQRTPASEAEAVPAAEEVTTAARRPRPTLRDVADIAPRKPQVPDEFLLRELERSRGGRMRDIVETIRRDQMELVTGSPTDVLVIQGGPGTGKSAVGLHRVTWLVHNGHFTAGEVLVVGPHQRFLSYVGRVLPTLGVRDVNTVQLERLWATAPAGAGPPLSRQVKSDERMAAVLRARVERNCRPEALDSLTDAPSFPGDEAAVVVSVGSTTMRVGRAEVLNLVEVARAGDGPYRQRRDRFRAQFVDLLVHRLAERSRRSRQNDSIRRDLERNKQVVRVIDRLWPSPSARETLRTLYDSAGVLRECAKGVLDQDERTALHRPRAASVDEEPWTLEDQVCLEELEYLISGDIPRRYGHIVIDEAQDLTPLQARVLRRRLAVNGSMTVLGDLAQATGPHTHGSWELLARILSDEGDHRSAELGTSYRVPSEIMEFVAPLARAIAPDVPAPSAIRSAGPDAARSLYSEPWKLLDTTVAEVMRLLGTDDGGVPRSVAVIVPDDAAWLDEITRRLREEMSTLAPELREAASVMPAGQAKGMEYDHVLVLEPTTIADRGPAGLRQLYIALTRSTQTLTVLHTAPLPQALTGAPPVSLTPPAKLADAPSGVRQGAAQAAGATVEDQAPALGESTTAEADEAGEASLGGRDVPAIGTDIRVRVTGRAPGGRYKVEPVSPPTTRPLVLTVRSGSVPPRLGDELDCWVLNNETNLSVLTSSQRGRRPISPKMAARYVSALAVLDELDRGDTVDTAVTRERLSELRGMANRVLRRDQADWVEVHRLLGSPDREALEQLRDMSSYANRAVKEGSLASTDLAERYRRSGWRPRLGAARSTLRQRMEEGREASPPDGSEQDRPAHDVPSSNAAPPPALHIPEQKEASPVETDADTLSRSPRAIADPLRAELTAAASEDRNCGKHEAVRRHLQGTLLWAGFQPEESPVVDLSCVDSAGRHLYEVLPAGRSSYPDLRAGATRLLEINHALSAETGLLHLVLCEPPVEEWAARTIHGAFGVRVLWRAADGGWSGDLEASALGDDDR